MKWPEDRVLTFVGPRYFGKEVFEKVLADPASDHVKKVMSGRTGRRMEDQWFNRD
jgi:hypothetical protein